MKLALAVTLAVTLAALAPTPAPAADFYMFFDKCKFAVGYLVQSDESLKVFDGDPLTTQCIRTAQNIRCYFGFTGGANSVSGKNWDDYSISIDSPPLLMFTNRLATDYYVIDTVKHSAVLTVRVLDSDSPTTARYSGAKVCQGTYLTESSPQTNQKREGTS